MQHEWLDHAVFYEIYPQSFRDSNADGIGDIPGIIEKLDYIQSLGCNAIWMNPCFESPFVDAGYDVKDYYKVAPRYGTNEDLVHLFQEVHKRGMHLILDLVPGHTSVECNWWKESQKDEKNEYTDRYIWTNHVFEDFTGISSIRGAIAGGTERCAACACNFYNAQPALNYGFEKLDPDRPWEQPTDAPGPKATVEELKNIMRFWLGLGCDGFRCDMAMSLVKNDDEKTGTIRVWQNIRHFLDEEFPNAVLVSEWGDPSKSLMGGFHMDFLLHFGPSHYPDLFRTDKPYFSRKGEGSVKEFFEIYNANREKVKGKGGMICIPSGNHDMDRMARTLDMDEMKMAFLFLLTMPGVPFIYYGDEVGQKYVENLKSVEGGYARTGSRSPMAFDTSTNGGFSSAPASELYIPQDPSIKERNAQVESKDPDSLYNTVKELIRLRQGNPALFNRGTFKLVSDGYPLVYVREEVTVHEGGNPDGDVKENGEKLAVLLNPADREVKTGSMDIQNGQILYGLGALKGQATLSSVKGEITLPAMSAAVVKLS